MFCYKCGKQIGNDSAFCEHCGASQTAGGVPPTGAPYVPPPQQVYYPQQPPQQQGYYNPAPPPPVSVKKQNTACIVLAYLCYAFAVIDFCGMFLEYDITGVPWSPIVAGVIGSVFLAMK
jgi:hypothetical protein